MVVNGYTLFLGAPILVGDAAGDRFGVSPSEGAAMTAAFDAAYAVGATACAGPAAPDLRNIGRAPLMARGASPTYLNVKHIYIERSA